MRLILTLLRILPWWGYAAITALLAPLVYDELLNYQFDQEQLAQAMAQGAPPLQKVGLYDGSLTGAPLREVQLTGILRSDLGIGDLGESVPKTFIILDSVNQQGPLVAVLFVGSDDQEGLTELIRTADQNGLITANGFQRTADQQSIRGELLVQGEGRAVVVVEGMAGSRGEALRAKAQDGLFSMAIVGGVALISALTALWRFRNWRRRVAQQRKGTPARPTKNRDIPPTPQPTKNLVQPRSDASASNPLGGNSGPWQQSQARQSAPPPVPGQARAKSPSKPRSKPAEQSDVAELSQFESVFPGGGSGFRFKTADEIIRETFGTVSRLTDVTPPK